jgi:8-amino-7-oxononanoate synthase
MPVMHSPPGAETIIDGRPYLYFAGTGYLGLQGHPEVIRAACEATQRYGIGSATSRGGFGDTPPVLEVERRAAWFYGSDDAFYFASGYMGGHILVLILEGTFDAVFADESSHYSVLEAARLSGRPVSLYRHGDPQSLEGSLRSTLKPGGRPLVLSDGVFSARGDVAPVAEYCRVLQEYDGAALCIDDAHGVAVLGEHGRGTYEGAGIWGRGVNRGLEPGDRDPRLFLYGTLSKAVGGFGGILPGSRRLVEAAKARSHLYAGASAPPVPAAAATAKALEMIAADPGLRPRLWENARSLKHGLRAMGLAADESPVPIVSLTLGDAANMQRVQRELMARGIAIAYMHYSGLGPEGALRLAVFATHTDAMIGRLLDGLRAVV